jgi:predicted NAD/FAD-dependent oxidoreductase
MSALERRMTEDRALRDAAFGLVMADLQLIRGDLQERGIGGRIADRVGDSTMDIVDEAADFAEKNKGKVAAGLAAIVLWFARGPIFDALNDLLGDMLGDDQDDAEGDDPDWRYPG